MKLSFLLRNNEKKTGNVFELFKNTQTQKDCVLFS